MPSDQHRSRLELFVHHVMINTLSLVHQHQATCVIKSLNLLKQYSYIHLIQLAIYHIIIHFVCITVMYETMQRRIGVQTHEYILKQVHVL